MRLSRVCFPFLFLTAVGCVRIGLNAAAPVADVPVAAESVPAADDVIGQAPTNNDPLDGTPKLTRSVAGALQTMMDNAAKSKQLSDGLPALCEQEIGDTKKMLAAGSQIDNTERNKDKAALASALADRVDGLKALMGKLKTIRKRLRIHIIRINEAFTAKNAENTNAMKAATAVKKKERELKLLLLPAAETGPDTSTALDDNTLFLEVPAVPEQGADLESNPITEAAEAETVKKLAQLAQGLYDQVITNVMMTRTDLESERSIMGAFRDRLREMILKREAKLAKLTMQLAALKQNIAAGGSFKEDILPLLAGHLKIITQYHGVVGDANAATEMGQSKVIGLLRVDPSPEVVAENVTVAIAPAANVVENQVAEPSATGGWQDSLADARSTTVTVGFAFQGYGLDAFNAPIRSAVLSAFATYLALAESKVKMEQVVALHNDPLSVKAVISINVGGDPASGVMGKLANVGSDPQAMLRAIRESGASQMKAITVTTKPKEVQVKEKEM